MLKLERPEYASPLLRYDKMAGLRPLIDPCNTVVLCIITNALPAKASLSLYRSPNGMLTVLPQQTAQRLTH